MADGRVVQQEGPLAIVEAQGVSPDPHTLVWIGPQRIPGLVIHSTPPRFLVFVCGMPRVQVGDEVVVSQAHPVLLAGPGWLGRVHELRFPLQHWPAGYGQEVIALPPSGGGPPVFRVQVGQRVHRGDLLAEIPEEPGLQHPVFSPAEGVVRRLNPHARGLEPVVELETPEGRVPVFAGSLEVLVPGAIQPRLWVTFQRSGVQVLDLFFPMMAGAMTLVTGAREDPLAALLQHIARFGDHDLVVYVADRRHRPVLEHLADRVRGVFLVADCTGTYRGEFLALLGRTLAGYYRRLGLRVLQITDASCAWLETMEALWRALEATGYEAAQTVVLDRVARCLDSGALDRTPEGRFQALTHILATLHPLEDLPDPLISLIFDRIRTLWRLDPLPGETVFPPLRWTASYATHAEILQQQTERLVDEEFPEQLREIRRLLEHYEALILEKQGPLRPEDRLLGAWVRLFQRHFWHQPPGTPPLPFPRAAWFLRLLVHLWDWSRTVQRPLPVPESLLQEARERPLERPEVFQDTLEQLLQTLSPPDSPA